MKRSGMKFMCLVTCLGAALTLPLFAQQGGGGGGGGGAGGGAGGGGGGGGPGRRMDPAAMRQWFNDQIKKQLGASDEDWKALQPKIEKVTTLQRDSRGGGMFGRGGRGPGGDTGGSAAPHPPRRSDVVQKVKDLQAALDNIKRPSATRRASYSSTRSMRSAANAGSAWGAGTTNANRP